jgi:predicted metal-dependent hydrolase
MTFTFPSHRHIPASGSTPDRAPLDAVKTLTPPRVSEDTWRHTPAYAYGLHLYTHGFFWEAHEVWEAVWLATAPNSQERHLLAGLIQLANACLKLEMAQPKAALRLLRDAQDHLDECRRPALLGLAPRVLVQDVSAFANRLAATETGKLRSVLALRPKPVLAGAD